MKKDKSVKSAERSAAIKRQLKSLIGPFIIFAIIISVVLFIALYEEAEEVVEIIKVNTYEGTEELMVVENDNLKLEMDPTTTRFSITNKSTGKVWYSNPVDAESDTLALNMEKDKLLATLFLTYSTQNGVDTLLNNYTYSMKNGIYEIEQGEDYIKVFYSIGDTEKEYIIPPVIRADRMEELVAKMDKQHSTRIGDYYKKLDINNLSKKDAKNKDELLTKYPIMETEVIYILRDTTKPHIRAEMEGTFAEVGYTMEEYAADKELDKSVTVSDKPVFNVNVIYRLEGNDLVVEVPYSEIENREDYPVYYLSLLPYFGAGGMEDEGFMLVPEGGGALINFNNGKVAQNSYYANVYGWDMAQDRDAIVHETETCYNVFGEAHGEDSFICILEEGAPYAAVQADISGRNNSYNYINAVFSMYHREQYDVGDRTVSRMFVYEDALPDERIVQRYRFIDSNDYVDMAECYRDYLIEKNGDYLTKVENAGAPVVVEVLGAVDKIEQVCGVPVSRPVKLTKFSEAETIIDDLYQNGFTNMSVKLSGWMNGGVQQKMLNKVDVLSELGGKKQLKNFIASATENNVDVYFDGITHYAYDSDILDGFNYFFDAARYVSKERVALHPYNTVSYNKRDSQDPHYLLKPELIAKMTENLVKGAEKYNANVSFRDYGKDLSSDFYKKDVTTRQEAMLAQSEQLKGIDDSGMNIMINMGNDYAVPYADIITNMDLMGAEYSIIDKRIPFYQLALHGLVNYTGESLNLTQNYKDELLRSAEYGAGLSFTVMAETPFALQKTLYSQYFGSEYAAWREQMIDIYNRYNAELGHVFNLKMVDHEVLTESLSCTTYEDGTKVYVNYGYSDAVAADGTKVAAKDYTVVK